MNTETRLVDTVRAWRVGLCGGTKLTSRKAAFCESDRRVEFRPGKELSSALDRDGFVVGFAGDEDAAMVALVGEPKKLAPAGATFYTFGRVGVETTSEPRRV